MQNKDLFNKKEKLGFIFLHLGLLLSERISDPCRFITGGHGEGALGHLQKTSQTMKANLEESLDKVADYINVDELFVKLQVEGEFQDYFVGMVKNAIKTSAEERKEA